MSKLVITLAGINAFVAVSLGAFASHTLHEKLSPEWLKPQLGGFASWQPGHSLSGLLRGDNFPIKLDAQR